ncbi:hypothetical protein RB195_001352 [Necator americanus]|uniref:Uncharacterized protein n=1 Tax=Necator americanus TaxID=51031 RepID=A0ABR1DES1_NECAM
MNYDNRSSTVNGHWKQFSAKVQLEQLGSKKQMAFADALRCPHIPPAINKIRRANQGRRAAEQLKTENMDIDILELAEEKLIIERPISSDFVEMIVSQITFQSVNLSLQVRPGRICEVCRVVDRLEGAAKIQEVKKEKLVLDLDSISVEASITTPGRSCENSAL